MKKNALRSGMTLAPAGEPKEDAEPAAPPRSETPELLSGYLAKIGKGSLADESLRSRAGRSAVASALSLVLIHEARGRRVLRNSFAGCWIDPPPLAPYDHCKTPRLLWVDHNT